MILPRYPKNFDALYIVYCKAKHEGFWYKWHYQHMFQCPHGAWELTKKLENKKNCNVRIFRLDYSAHSHLAGEIIDSFYWLLPPQGKLIHSTGISEFKEELKEEPDRPKIGVGVVVRRNGKVLIHKRKTKRHGFGTWAFPGGHLEKWESLEDCAMRELAEEAGPDIKVTKPAFWTFENAMYRDEDKHYITMFLVCDWISGEAKVMEPDKCECWEWHSWDNLPKPLMLSLEMLKKCNKYPWE